MKKRNKIAVSIACVLALAGCGSNSNEVTVIDCSYPFETEGDVMKYSFKFTGDDFTSMSVTLGTDLSDSGEDVYKDTLDATIDVVNAQNEIEGVNASYESDDTKMTLTETVTVDITKYDVETDALKIFGSKDLDDITEEYVLDNYANSGYTVTVNGEKVE